MFTKKSLIIGLALLLSVICAGSAGAFASSVTPATPQNAIDPFLTDGIPAITTNNASDILSPQNVLQFLDTQGFAGGPTVNGLAPVVQAMGLTNLSNLKRLANLTIPGLSPDQQVYYTQLKGPFALNRNLPLPLLSTLLPSVNNLSTLSTLPLFSQLPDLTSVPLLGNLENDNTPNGGLSDILPVLPDGDSLNNLLGNGGLLNNGPDATNNNSFSNNGPTSTDLPGQITSNLSGLSDAQSFLGSVYEVFDAHSGNLLAWG